MIINEQDTLAHIGTPRHSGRYPWGSGGTAEQRNKSLLDHIDSMKAKGLSDKEIYEGLGMTSTEYRDRRAIAKNAQKQADIAMATRLKMEDGYSNVAIGKKMGINESSVRSLLAAAQNERVNILQTTANFLRDQVAEKQFVDVGSGNEQWLGISKEKLGTAIALLKEEGYVTHKVQVDQLGTAAGNKTTIRVLAPPGTTYRDIVTQKDKIKMINGYSEDGGRTMLGIHPPLSLNSKRLDIKYAEQGGDKNDGVIYVRPGVSEVSLGGSRYSQVRISVDGTHYIKGMAMYKDDLPEGVDVQFNTSKSDTGNKLDALKPLKEDPDNPFGSSIRRQLTEVLPDGTVKVKSVMNLVNEEGTWETWKKALSSQVLSKQAPALAKQQLEMTYERRKAELDSIKSLTNPAVRKKLLAGFADGTDSAAIHLHAAALPRQMSHVILPINSMKPTEIYAPNYRNGERVALIRYPHGGIFEIPELTVNNNHPEAKSLLGRAPDAIGINHEVAKRLSGADFDGDTVLVIPNPVNNPHLKTQPALVGLKDFDPQRAYPAYEGMKPMTSRMKGSQMGLVSNLITDMTIQGAGSADVARAIKHSMVVIDAEKHNLNYKLSAKDNNIPQLMKKYQNRAGGGASTLISKATSPLSIRKRRAAPTSKGGPIDKATGKKLYEDVGDAYINKKGKVAYPMTSSTKLAEADDAHSLVSKPGTPIERVYADHSNRLKALANEARKEMVNTKSPLVSPSAKIVYANEVKTLDAKLNTAYKNKPLERQAQVLANAKVQAVKDANPTMDNADLKKVKGQALLEARRRTKAEKQQIEITDQEWAAIQAGAITNHKLEEILNNANIDRVKELATPSTRLLMTSAKKNRAAGMLANGYSQAEVADALGVSLSTLKATLADG